MAGLQRFKLFAAAHCGLEPAVAAGNPALSPTKSPVFHLRRRKTLRMLFDRNSSDDRRRDLRQILEESTESDRNSRKKKKENRARRKLKELLVTSPSPPFEERGNRSGGGEERREIFPGNRSSGWSGSLRYRILRKAWRPVLVSIPEQ